MDFQRRARLTRCGGPSLTRSARNGQVSTDAKPYGRPSARGSRLPQTAPMALRRPLLKAAQWRAARKPMDFQRRARLTRCGGPSLTRSARNGQVSTDAKPYGRPSARGSRLPQTAPMALRRPSLKAAQWRVARSTTAKLLTACPFAARMRTAARLQTPTAPTRPRTVAQGAADANKVSDSSDECAQRPSHRLSSSGL